MLVRLMGVPGPPAILGALPGYTCGTAGILRDVLRSESAWPVSTLSGEPAVIEGTLTVTSDIEGRFRLTVSVGMSSGPTTSRCSSR